MKEQVFFGKRENLGNRERTLGRRVPVETFLKIYPTPVDGPEALLGPPFGV
jgi:hypothetical protein